MPTRSKSRSGTQWTEEQLSAAGYERMHLRVKKGTKAKFTALAEHAGQSMSDLFEAWVEHEFGKLCPSARNHK